MRHHRLHLPLLVAGLLLVASAPTFAGLGVTERVSADSGDSGGRELPAIDADGRFVVFVGRSASSQGVYLYDRLLGATTRLTTSNDMNPDVSGDGRFVAYARYGSTRPVYLLDRVTGQNTLVSKASDGSPANGLSDFPSVSFDGRYVAFQSTADNLDPTVGDPGPGGGPTKVYVHDRMTGMTRMASVTSDGFAARGNAVFADLSADGRFVAFASDADNFTLNGPHQGEAGVQHVYRHDRQTGETILVSKSSAGIPGDLASAGTVAPTLSADGHRVAFESDSTNLVDGDTNGLTDAFVHDVMAGSTIRISLDGTGAEVFDFASNAPAISGDGRYVAFTSRSSALVPGDVNGVADIFVRDLLVATIERASLAVAGGTEASGTRLDPHTGEMVPQINGADPAINRDGRFVAFVGNGDLAADRPLGEGGTVSTEPAVFVRQRSGTGGFHALAPVRLLDTRTGLGAPAGKVGPGGVIELAVLGAGGVPANGVQAVVLNVTVTEPTAASHLTIFPTGAPRPVTSNLNFEAGQTLPNLAFARVGDGGRVSLYNLTGATHVIADVFGWISTASVALGYGFNPVAPARMLDTRLAPIGGGDTIEVGVTGIHGVPALGVGAVALRATATEPTAASHLTIYPTGLALPGVANLNVLPNQTIGNSVAVGVGKGGSLSLSNFAGSVHAVLDLAGWFADGTETAGGGFVSDGPQRLADSRTGAGGLARLGPGEAVRLQVTGNAGVPSVGVSAVVLNATVVSPTAPSHLTIFPEGVDRPGTSCLNFPAGKTVGGLVFAMVGDGGGVEIFNLAGDTDLVLDVLGWFTDL